jgi:hypothetical protein
VRSGRKLLPILWAHHDDRTYIGPPYVPFERLGELLKSRGGSGYGIIHWTTRPLDLYFKSLAEQSWDSGAARSLEATCEEMAAKTFGEAARKSGGAYLQAWVRTGRMFGRETTDRFIDVALKDAEQVIAGAQERIAMLDRIGSAPLTEAGKEWLGYFRDYERFTQEFFRSHMQFEKGDPEGVIRRYVAAARRGHISRGEEALVVSLSLRWLPFLVSARQAHGIEPVRIKFGVTQHEPLAQGAGKNTFFFDKEKRIWRVLGEMETGLQVFDMEAGEDELGHSGIRIERPLKLKLGAMMGEPLQPGRYSVQLVFLARQSSAGL